MSIKPVGIDRIVVLAEMRERQLHSKILPMLVKVIFPQLCGSWPRLQTVLTIRQCRYNAARQQRRSDVALAAGLAASDVELVFLGPALGATAVLRWLIGRPCGGVSSVSDEDRECSGP